MREVIPCTKDTPCLACAEGMRLTAAREEERKASEKRQAARVKRQAAKSRRFP